MESSPDELGVGPHGIIFMDRLKLPARFSCFLSLMLMMLPFYRGWVAVALKSLASLPRAPSAGDRYLEWLPEVKA